jgi:hypothetical protein
MKKVIVSALVCLMLVSCTTTNVKSASATNLGTPEAHSKGLLVQPDVQLSLLTAAGLQERREDWSRAGQANLASAVGEQLKSRSHPFEALDPAASMDGRVGQLLRLHEAVGQSILVHEYGALKLPTKKDGFDWTLGDGAQAIKDAKGADYALFVTARGSYSSAGRKAMMVGAALLGVSVPLGSQQVFASLVDLRTGRVVWFNVAVAGPSADVRSPEGAQALATDLLKGIPL